MNTGKITFCGNEIMAAKELRRYLYLREGKLYEVEQNSELKYGEDCFVTAHEKSELIQYINRTIPGHLDFSGLGEDGFLIKTIIKENRKITVLSGRTQVSTLYAVYEYAEQMGVGFSIHGDIYPEKKLESLPEIDCKKTPLFSVRGLHPFHDFPEGPDWWEPDDYKAVMEQMTKMKMNFIGFHTYPETTGEQYITEPMVWIGQSQDILGNGRVKHSYPAMHFTTAAGSWGYSPLDTSGYIAGAGNLFEDDFYGAGYMKQYRLPYEKYFNGNANAEAFNPVFNEFAQVLKEVFSYADHTGIKSCIGIEVPLSIPDILKKRLEQEDKNISGEAVLSELYKGIFTRITRSHPLDYFWLWTPENWTWYGNSQEEAANVKKHMQLALEAASEAAPGLEIVTCGWTLGPMGDNTMFDRYLPKDVIFSCINRNLGKDPVDLGFSKIKGRDKWAIPWLEDDHNLLSFQLWAGRIRKDAMDAQEYGCNGLLGIHWRTRVMSPNISALAKAAWDQKAFSKGKDEKAFNKSNAENTGRYADSLDFYKEWCTKEFGMDQGISDIFAGLDCRMHMPCVWSEGPGFIGSQEGMAWEQVQEKYAFMDGLYGYLEQITDSLCRERFIYWMNIFEFSKALARIGCDKNRFDEISKEIDKSTNPDERKLKARRELLPVWNELAGSMEAAVGRLMCAVSTKAELGTMCNLQSRSIKIIIELCLGKIREFLGDTEVIMPSKNVPETVAPRLIIPTARGRLEKGEIFSLKALVTGEVSDGPVLFLRKMGEGEFKEYAFRHINRSVFTLSISPEDEKIIWDDYEYYIRAGASNKELCFPAGGKNTPQTVIVV